MYIHGQVRCKAFEIVQINKPIAKLDTNKFARVCIFQYLYIPSNILKKANRSPVSLNHQNEQREATNPEVKKFRWPGVTLTKSN